MIICILFSKYVPKVRVAVRDCSRHVAHACLVCIPLSGDSCWSPHHAAFPGTHNEPSIHINHLQVPLYGSLICHILPEIEMYIQPHNMQCEQSNVPNPTCIHHFTNTIMNRDKDNIPSVSYNPHINHIFHTRPHYR